MEEGDLEGRASRSATQSSCEVCAKILAFFSIPFPQSAREDLGLFKSFLVGQCPHVLFFENVRWTWNRPSSNKDDKVLSIHKHPNTMTVFFELKDSVPAENHTWAFTEYLKLIHRKEIPNHSGHAAVIDKQWVNIDLVRTWITSCHESHRGRCTQSPSLGGHDIIRPRYLVDTLCSCLVIGSEVQTEYVALSYQWGQIRTLRNTLQISNQLLISGSLSDGEFASHVPQTIRDAFVVTKHLGYRYLWVDSLCIVQDDDEQLNAELSQMHRIYACASLTIIAADGADAGYGLRGIQGVTAPRTLYKTIFQLAGSEQLMADTSHSVHNLSERPGSYFTRAWTFQEDLFSTRKLFFMNEGVKWRCRFGERDEDMFPDEYGWLMHESPLSLRLDQKALPILPDLNPILNDYNRRNLSFAEDAFPAFVGTQTMLHQIHQNGLNFGLPEYWFDIALNWIPGPLKGHLNRRVVSNLAISKKALSALPSWSWVGWAGNVTFEDNVDLVVDVPHLFRTQGFTEPITEWYALDSPSSAYGRRIRSDWHEFRTRSMDESSPLPEGWTRVEDDLSFTEYRDAGYATAFPSQKMPTSCFRHPRTPDRLFWYPFPIPEPTSASSNTPSPQNAYIAAKTSRAYLFGSSIQTERSYGHFDRFQIWVTCTNGQHVGYLELNNEDDLRSFTISGDEARSAVPVELVATCKGYSKKIFESGKNFDVELAKVKKEWHMPPYDPWTNDSKACYFVLWIEWVDGIAYRKGCGAVRADVWEQEKEEELVNLIMG